ncbi:unnamed protein product [Eretmochelys imbricata]
MKHVSRSNCTTSNSPPPHPPPAPQPPGSYFHRQRPQTFLGGAGKCKGSCCVPSNVTGRQEPSSWRAQRGASPPKLQPASWLTRLQFPQREVSRCPKALRPRGLIQEPLFQQQNPPPLSFPPLFASSPLLLASLFFFSFPHFPLCLDFFPNPSLPFHRLPCASPSSQAASGLGGGGAQPLRPGRGRAGGGHEAAPELGGGRARCRAGGRALLAAGLGGGSPAAGAWRRGGGRRGRGMRRGQPLQEEEEVKIYLGDSN